MLHMYFIIQEKTERGLELYSVAHGTIESAHSTVQRCP